jgi:molybdopterin converting factor small subunit
MGMILIDLSPPFASRIGRTRLEFEIVGEEETVQGVLRKLATLWGDRIEPLLFTGDGGMLPGLMVMVNNRVFTVSSLNEKDVRLKDGDTLSLMYFVSGG